ncbi:uncharacterized protein LOC143341885 isoform X2 [Colletes latitarsis]|uniref:uncharacterized protein LOC143341885 isoform X2 n=1 Tax=Colletes latitarsis TaxID=2605962 RepID=UPI0040368104
MFLKPCLPPTGVPNNATATFDPGLGCSADPRLLFQGSSAWVPETDKPYMCSSCGKGYTHIFTLNRHRRTVCGKIRNTNGKWKCPRCTRSYVTEGNLVRHVSLIRHLRNFHNESFDSTNGAGVPPEFQPMDTCHVEGKSSDDSRV